VAVSTIPDVTQPASLADYLRVMTRAVFQTGLSWRAIAAHWESYEREFHEFDVTDVATFGDTDIDRLMHADGVLHSSRKIRATIKNAQTLQELDREHAGFAKYLGSFPTYKALAGDLKRRFVFMGEMNAWYFLFRTGHPVPPFEQWVKTIPGDHPRMKEMVEKARSEGRSSELPQ
jgi:3-methyladenine DNA glycosylase Tag